MRHSEHRGKEHSGRFFGFVLIVIGLLWLLNRLNISIIPSWLISGPVIVIVLGLIFSIKTKFRRLGPIFIALLGTTWLIKKYNLLPPEMNYLFMPVILIILGVFILLRPKKSNSEERPNKFNGGWEESDIKDKLEIDSMFCGSRKRILSKDFKGGEINIIFGGSELNLSQANIESEATIDVSIMFGGLKIIVPSNWEVKTQMTTIAAGVEDKRGRGGLEVVPDKTLILKGTVLFGGVDIQNY